MRLYQCTSQESAHAIMAQGFRDAWGYYLTDRLWYGVWFSDVPHPGHEDTGEEVLLAVDLDVPDDQLGEYAWVDFGKPYRMFLLPAELVNRRGTLRVVEDDWRAVT